MDVIHSQGWTEFFQELSREYAGRRATVAQRHAYGWRNIALPMSLDGVAMQNAQDDPDGPIEIRVAGHAATGPVAHTVEQPQRVRRIGIDGAIGVVIEQLNGPPTIICIWPGVDRQAQGT